MPHESRRATIALIGIDGAGKTTQATRLAEWLTTLGHPVRYRLAASGRRVLGNAARHLGRRDSVALLGPRMALRAETWLRHANLVAARNAPILVADRYDVCQYARTRMLYPAMEPWVRRRLSPHPDPDVTLFLEIPPEVAHLRVKERGIDHETVDELIALDAAYRSLPEAGEYVFVDANREPDTVSGDIRAEVRSALPGLFPGRALLSHGPLRRHRRVGISGIPHRRGRRLPRR
ncbi:dTMP kinase [Stackebrandtia albiflava]|uniref:dTMP kinase n=1 Tax=Stackebrandtia albiflava TaxID=406432 RepID=UPI0013153662|nr:dTMP kinase [Stackebrandtia albiflava]